MAIIETGTPMSTAIMIAGKYFTANSVMHAKISVMTTIGSTGGFGFTRSSPSQYAP